MARRSTQYPPIVPIALALWRATSNLPAPMRYGLITLAVLGGLAFLYLSEQAARTAAVAANQPVSANNPDGSTSFLFCTWNVENLFDDKVDKGRREVDRPFDIGFAEDDKVRQQKLDQIASALLKMNGGIGPDIISCMEVESVRAADLLRATLNKKLDEAKADPKLKYTQVSMKNIGNDAGRHIAPALITRLNVAHAFTKLHGRNLRVLESRLFINGHELSIISSHWTSQIRQSDGSDGEGGRNRYANTISQVFETQYEKNPKVDFLVCGDFNDTPESNPVLKGLRAIGDKNKVVSSEEPFLLDLLNGKPAAQFGTLWYNGKPLIYDHICVSKGLLDNEGWSVEPESIRTYTEGLIAPGASRREPWRFGDPDNAPRNGRGFSDHFPVLVKLKVQPTAKKENKPE
jgi:endonuclease/exonuclease/phosphatase family metal-dependent hydrolase